MTELVTKFYLERSLPLRYRQSSPDETRNNNLEGAVEKAKLWQTRILYVDFLDGDQRVHKRVEEHAKEWCRHANIAFVFGRHPSPQIRTSFKDQFSWSYVGRDCEEIPAHEPTMNFGWLKYDSSDETYSAVVLHEFGHALGMIHEHQSPAIDIQWDKPAVIKYFTSLNPPWSIPDIERNIFYRYDEDQTQFGTFDPHSIMVYPIESKWTLNGWGVQENIILSQTDKDFIRQCYP